MDIALKIMLVILVVVNSFRLGRSYESFMNSYNEKDSED